MKRKPTPQLDERTLQQQQKVDLAKSMGVQFDPMAQMLGLVQLLNASEESGRFDQEMQYRQQGQDMQAEQFDRTQAFQYAGLDQAEENEQGQADRWLQDFSLRKLLGEQEQTMQLKQMEAMKGYHDQSFIGQLLGIPLGFAQAGLPGGYDQNVLNQHLSRGGLGGLFNPTAPAHPTIQPRNAQEAIQLKARTDLGY